MVNGLDSRASVLFTLGIGGSSRRREEGEGEIWAFISDFKN